MTTYPRKEFVRKDGSLDIEKAMQAGHHARSEAIMEFGALLSAAARAATKVFALRKV